MASLAAHTVYMHRTDTGQYLVVVMILYGSFVGRTRFEVKEVTYTSPRLPQASTVIVLYSYPTFISAVGKETLLLFGS